MKKFSLIRETRATLNMFKYNIYNIYNIEKPAKLSGLSNQDAFKCFSGRLHKIQRYERRASSYSFSHVDKNCLRTSGQCFFSTRGLSVIPPSCLFPSSRGCESEATDTLRQKRKHTHTSTRHLHSSRCNADSAHVRWHCTHQRGEKMEPLSCNCSFSIS